MSELNRDTPGDASDEVDEFDTDRQAADTEPAAVDADASELDAEPAVASTEPDETDSEPDTDPDETDSQSAAPDTAVVGTSDAEINAARPPSGWANLRLGEPVVARPTPAATPDATTEPAGVAEPGGASAARWREIQAVFVDDPRGSVEQALHAIDDEVTAVIDALRRRQVALTPTGQANGESYAGQAAGPGFESAADSNPADTERLRVALRDCRAFWTDLAELGDRLG
jgi:hypothetical protein